MKKSGKIIIYMLVALFVAVSVVLVDAGFIYAKSYSEDVEASDWHSFKMCEDLRGSSREVSSYDYLSNYDTFPEKYTVNTDLGYVEDSVFVRKESDGTAYFYQRQLTSSEEIVFLAIPEVSEKDAITLWNDNSYTGKSYFGYLSLDEILHSFVSYALIDTSSWKRFSSYANSTSSKVEWRYGDYAGKYFSLYDEYDGKYDSYADGKYVEYSCMPGKMKVFSDFDSAYKYLTTGDTSGMAWQGSAPKQTYSSELAFTSFDMSVHDSNSFDDYYLEFLYKCPDAWLGKNPKLVINQTWDYNIFYFDNKGISSPLTVNGSNTCALSVSSDKNSIKIPLGQLDCLKEFVSSSNNVLGASSEMKRRVLGSSYSSPPLGKVLTFNGLPIRADASYKVDKSFLSLSCVVYVDGVAGHEYAGSVDLISGDNSMASYTPDAGGNYTFNDDYKSGGRYYTDVSKDAAGNTTYNYYYYGTDGSKKKVSSEDAASNTLTNTIQDGAIRIDNSPTFNNNITVEGDTISNSANSYADSKSDATTNKSFIDKFLGFFEIIENNSFLGVFSKIFAWLPTGISSLVTTALGIIVGIRVFKAFH